MLLEINEKETSLSFRSMRCPKLQVYIIIFCINLQSLVWSSHVSVPPLYTSMLPQNSVNPRILWLSRGMSI